MANLDEEIRNGVEDEEISISEEVEEMGEDDDGNGGDQEQSGPLPALANFDFAFITDPCWTSMREGTRNLYLKTWIR